MNIQLDKCFTVNMEYATCMRVTSTHMGLVNSTFNDLPNVSLHKSHCLNGGARKL